MGGFIPNKHPIFHNSLMIVEQNGKLAIENIKQVMKKMHPTSNGKTYLYYDKQFVEVQDFNEEETNNDQGINLQEKDLKGILNDIENTINALKNNENKQDVKKNEKNSVGLSNENNTQTKT